MSFDESTNYHDPVAPGQEVGLAERQLDAAITELAGPGTNTSGLQVIYIATSDGTVADSATEETVIGTEGVGELELPAAFFQEGIVLRVTAAGYLSSAAGTANVRFRVKLGSTIICNTGDFIPAQVTNKYWRLDALLACRTAGSSGEIMANGRLSYDDGDGVGLVNTAVSTVDTTAAQDFDLTVDWDTANASNEVVCTHLVLEKMQVANSALGAADVFVNFDQATSTAAVNTQTHSVTVILDTPGQLAQEVTVNWSSTNVSSPSTGSVTFPIGSANGATTTIDLNLDYTQGNPEVTLTNATNATVGDDDTHDVTIQWQHTFKFDEVSGSEFHTTYGDGGFGAIAGRGSHASGVGWQADMDSTNVSHQLNIFYTFSSPPIIRSATMTYNRTNGANVGPSFTSASYYNGGWAWLSLGTAPTYEDIVKETKNDEISPPGTGTLNIPASTYTNAEAIEIRSMSGYANPGPPNPTGESTVTRLVVNGDGFNPFA